MDPKKREFVTWSILTILVIVGVIGYVHRKESLKKTKTAVGWVVKHTQSHGRAISRPQIVCRVDIDGEARLINFDKNDLDVDVGECVLIRYSVSDPRITELQYGTGVVPCER